MLTSGLIIACTLLIAADEATPEQSATSLNQPQVERRFVSLNETESAPLPPPQSTANEAAATTETATLPIDPPAANAPAAKKPPSPYKGVFYENDFRYLDDPNKAGTDVGEEIDLTTRFLLTPRADLLCGYSHLFPGPFLIETSGSALGRDFYYTQFSLKF